MTLQDLIARFQKIDAYFTKKYPHVQNEYKLLARLGKISEELGELNSAVHGDLQLHRADKQAKHSSQDVETEWADLFNTVMLFGLVKGIDMPKVIDDRLAYIFKRFKISGKNSAPAAEPHPTAKEKTTFHVGVIITLYNDEGKILLAKRAPFKTHAANVWENISGAVEAGEQPLEALERETREELGPDVRYQVQQVYNTFQTVLQNGREIIGISYLCKYLGGEITLNEEHTEYRWVTIEEAIDLTDTLGLKQEFTDLAQNYPHLFTSQK